MRDVVCLAGVLVLGLAACHPAEPVVRPAPHDPARSAVAVKAAQAGELDVAQLEAERVLAREPGDSTAAAIRAVARYEHAVGTLVHDLGGVIEQADGLKFFDHEAGRRAWTVFLADLDSVDRDLAVAQADPAFALELCLACWSHDWNRNGRIDERDRRLFEVERDAAGQEIESTDPRRRPTYRFDVGDVLWARAMVSFQRGLVELVLAYRWSELDKLFKSEAPVLTISLLDGSRVKRARDRFISALAFSAQEREAYLQETDDDREWVPSPRQKNYAMPLPMDAVFYERWGALLGDIQRLLASDEGIPIKDVAEIVVGKHLARLLPTAYVDLGRVLRQPTDIVIDLRGLDEATPASIERVTRGLLGNGYADSMRATPLIARLRHMSDELIRGEDSIESKLRYLLWVN
jgi:hypothetical protein